MKIQTTMKSPVSFPCILSAAVVASLLFASSLQAADKAATRKADVVDLPIPVVEPVNERIGHNLAVVNGALVWSGPKLKDKTPDLAANVANVVELLRELFPEANFIVSPGVGDVPVSDFKLRNANAEEALRAVCIASGPSVLWRNDSAAPAIDPATGLPVAASPQNQKPMYVLFENPDAVGLRAKPKPQIEAFSIGDYLASNLAGVTNADERARRIDQIVSELHDMVSETTQVYQKVTAEMDRTSRSSGKISSFRFHGRAGLLVVMGDSEGVSVAAKVIGALPGVKRSGVANMSDDDMPFSPSHPARVLRSVVPAAGAANPFGAPATVAPSATQRRY